MAQRRVAQFEESRGREPSPAERLRIWAEAAVVSRSPKRDDLGGGLFRQWRQDATDLGYDPAGLVASFRTAERVCPGRYDRPEVMAGSLWGAGVDDVVVGRVLARVEQAAVSLSDEGLAVELYTSINASAPMAARAGVDGRRMVDATFEDLRRRVCDRLVRHEGRWWSPGMIAAETAALSWLASDVVASIPAAVPYVGDLSGDQAEAVRALLGSATRGAVVVGPAGSGKTTMLARFAQTVGPGRVVAVAPTAVAAAELGGGLGVAADTVAKVLTERGRIGAGMWVIVDEASQLATRQLAALCGRAAEADARVVLVGDHAQQGSISAGGLFETAARNSRITVAALSELWRFADPAEAAATARLRVGDPAALDYHRGRGRVAASAHSQVASTVADWWEQHRGGSTLVSAPSLGLVADINVEIAARRRRAGETGPAVAGGDDCRVRVGDVVTTRRNNRRLVAGDGEWVRNGDRWVVEWSDGSGGLGVRRAGSGARVGLPAGYVEEHVDLGYAITHTRAQSATADAALTVVGASSRLPELYVGLTRGRHRNHLVVVTDRAAHDEDRPSEHFPPEEVIAAVVTRRGNPPTAISADQTVFGAGDAARWLARVAATGHEQALPVPHGFDPARLLATRRDPHAGAPVGLEQRVSTAIGRWLTGTGDTDPYEGLTDAEQQAADRWLHDYLNNNDNNGGGGDDAYGYEPDAGDLAAVGRRHTANSGHPELPPAAVYDHDAGALPYPDGWDIHPDDESGVPDPAPTPDEEEEPAAVSGVSDWVAGVEWRRDLGATGNVVDLVHSVLDEATGVTRDSVLGPFPPSEADNPHLMALTRRYTQARYVGADDAAGWLATLIYHIADRPLHDLLADQVDAGQVSAADREWAQHVRTGLVARRAHKWAGTLNALDSLRETIRTQAARTVGGADPDPRGVPEVADRLGDHDRAVWWRHCTEWLADGAQPDGLLPRWTEADCSLADAAAGLIPTETNPGVVHWSELAGARTPQLVDTDETDAARYTTQQTRRFGAPHVEGPEAPTGNEAERLRSVLGWAADQYHHQLVHSPEAHAARQHLQKRGIGPDDWDTWQLGWAPAGWRTVADRIGDDAVAVASGLANQARSDRVYDALRERIMFPIRDPNGHIAGFAGRTLDPDQPKYVNTRRTVLYDKSNLLFGLSHAAPHIADQGGEAVIVEGYTDAIAARRHGIANTVATGGTALTDRHVTQLAAAGATEITVMYDGDDAGRRATRQAAARAARQQLPVTITQLPHDQDPADLPPHTLRAVYDNTQPHIWAEIHTMPQRHNPAHLDNHHDIIERVLAVAANDPILETIAAQQTAALLNISPDTITDHLHTPDPGPHIAHGRLRAETAGRTNPEQQHLETEQADAAAWISDHLPAGTPHWRGHQQIYQTLGDTPFADVVFQKWQEQAVDTTSRSRVTLSDETAGRTSPDPTPEPEPAQPERDPLNETWEQVEEAAQKQAAEEAKDRKLRAELNRQLTQALQEQTTLQHKLRQLDQQETNLSRWAKRRGAPERGTKREQLTANLQTATNHVNKIRTDLGQVTDRYNKAETQKLRIELDVKCNMAQGLDTDHARQWIIDKYEATADAAHALRTYQHDENRRQRQAQQRESRSQDGPGPSL